MTSGGYIFFIFMIGAMAFAIINEYGVNLIWMNKLNNLKEPFKTIEDLNTLEPTGFKDVLFSKILQDYKIHYNKNITMNLTESRIVPTFLLYSDERGRKDKYWSEVMKDITIGNCALPCNFTRNLEDVKSANAIVVFLRGLKNVETLYEVLGSRNPKQPWIILTFENHIRANSIYGTDYNTLNGIFNRTMYSKRDSDIIVNHGFVVSNEDANYIPESWHIPVNNNYTLEDKLMAVGMISNCNDNSGRLKYVTELSKIVHVDIYGRCGNLKCGGSAYVEHGYKVNTDNCFKHVGETYLFYLSFENSICNDYVTEKLYNILYFPIIPVVLGGTPYADILPPNSYIDATYMPPEKLAELMLHLRNNKKKYLEYFKWKDYYKPSTIGGARTICHLCHRLHDQEFYNYNVVEDFYDWFVNKSECIDGNNNPTWLNNLLHS